MNGNLTNGDAVDTEDIEPGFMNLRKLERRLMKLAASVRLSEDLPQTSDHLNLLKTQVKKLSLPGLHASLPIRCG